MSDLAPDDIQPLDDRARYQAGRAERAVAALGLALLLNLRERITVAVLAPLLRASNYVDLTRLFQFDRSSEPATALARRLDDLSIAVADDEAERVPGGVFDPMASRFTAMALAARGRLMDQLDRTNLETLRGVMGKAIETGLAPEASAASLSLVAGLAPRMANAALSYADGLRQPATPGLADRAYHDRRFNPTPARDDAAAERMAARYVDRALAGRAAEIARTETVRAASEGQRAAWQQGIDRGDVPPNSLRSFWLTAHDERVCPVCAGIPTMNRRGVPFSQSFMSPSGPIDAPPAHPRCRCSLRHRVMLYTEPLPVAAQ